MNSSGRPMFKVAVVMLLVLLAGLFYWSQSKNPPSDSSMQLDQVLGEGAGQGNYLQAQPGTQLKFPDDHGQHPGFQNEWWYFTANLEDLENPERRFGVQLTLFRFAVADKVEQSGDNPWLAPDIYMGHFAITHVDENEHRASERFSRQGPGLAGANVATADRSIRFWLTDWDMRSQSVESLFPMVLKAADPEQLIAINLVAKTIKPRVLQGKQGFSQKNMEGGGSYYYSYPRLGVVGSLGWQDQQLQVSGEGWFDHEWSSNSLADYQQGWDWFSLQLADKRELMYYRFRNKDGSEGLSHLVLIEQDGAVRKLHAEEINLEVLDHWRSSDGTEYPAAWRLLLADENIDLEVRPMVADQQMDLSVSYWEGAVEVSGSHQGYGYVELAGYNN
ncbi:MAG: hypothetical protein OQK12_05445 [Motiliproteus sp.]|nr:hypothetical protein [Motiliproteus sp.]MCW9052847.1 hypothetical protein [Motiliproteus sp.]